MRIYKMTATFGKLEQATLELKPGLNIITAPNEWGKSTWCAFLVAMLYGLDTRAKTTKTALADKERYSPWSGSPMAGRIDLNWNGRDITIERRTKRRVPLGEFQAYETASGLPVPELTASNCGAVLLGVEQSVFRRAGFIRHADLPVTQDEALRRRLNALVSTGDDSGAADRLAEELRNLKNRCRYNRSGLLPQAEAERDALQEKIAELDTLKKQTENLEYQIGEIKNWLKQLQNHQQAQAYAKMQADVARVEEAQAVLEQLRLELRRQESECAVMAPLQEAEQMIRELRSFRENWRDLQTQLQNMPEEPLHPQLPLPFAHMGAEAAWEMVRKDAARFSEVYGTKAPLLLIVVGIFGLISLAGLVFMRAYVYAGIAGAAALVALIWGIWELRSSRKSSKELLEKYGHSNWKRWGDPIGIYERELAAYHVLLEEFQEIHSDLATKEMALEKKRESLCGSEEPDVALNHWESVQKKWDSYYNTRRETLRTESHHETLRSMVRTVEKPSMPDQLTQSEEETARLMTECAVEQQKLQNRLGQYQGRMEILGNRDTAQKQLEHMNARIARLEDTYGALVIAQETLAAARAELQRRFAPRITKRAQALLSGMTDGRYHSITMRDDFSLQAGAGQEETLHDALWRSDGTMDQLYLALRLAVAEELTPNAPLILDDVLVRFDDERMRAAVSILRELAENRQVICFTCQGRENEA